MRTINEKISILNELKLKIDKITKTKNEKKILHGQNMKKS